MKKLLLLTIMGVSIATPATAVYKCISLLPTTTCRAGLASAGFVSWSGTATNGLKYSGTATCAMTPSDNQKIQDTVYVSVSSQVNTMNTENSICFCRLVSPAVSKYVWAYTYASELKCAEGCAISCSNQFATTNSSLRTDILMNLLH